MSLIRLSGNAPPRDQSVGHRDRLAGIPSEGDPDHSSPIGHPDFAVRVDHQVE
jgi:hypothetical protein